jgi:hypothetical protein
VTPTPDPSARGRRLFALTLALAAGLCLLPGLAALAVGFAVRLFRLAAWGE